MKSSKFTKKTRAWYWTLWTIDLLMLISPILVYIIYAYANGQALSHQKIALTGCISIALILTLFNILTKRHLRSPLWILLIGIYCIIDNILPLVITLAVTTVADEFILSPAIEHFKTKLVADKAIDRRGL